LKSLKRIWLSRKEILEIMKKMPAEKFENVERDCNKPKPKP
jgi:hypothetical protein